MADLPSIQTCRPRLARQHENHRTLVHSFSHRAAPHSMCSHTQADSLTCLVGRLLRSLATRTNNMNGLLHLLWVLCDVSAGHAPVVQVCIGRLLASLTAKDTAISSSFRHSFGNSMNQSSVRYRTRAGNTPATHCALRRHVLRS